MKVTETLSSARIEGSVGRFGGKGSNLIFLFQNGLPVPNAFIICEEAFRDYCKPWIESIAANQEKSVSDACIDLLREQFDIYPLDPMLVDEIHQRICELTKDSPFLLAVRSSGIAEDLDMASFAGMNDTILNVHPDTESVCNAIKSCWKSLFSRRAIEYRLQHGFPLFDTSIAVIVQVMIPSERSGVAFTADPQTGSRSHICIDGVQGMGETLVSGLVNTDHWKIRKPFQHHSWNIEEEYILQDYKFISNYPKEGTSKIDLNETEATLPSFSKKDLDSIIQASLTIEKRYGKPMDIEFTFYEDKLYILQARPITHLLAIPDAINPILHPDATQWGLFINIGYFQMLTDAFTPMGYSTILHIAGVSSKYLLYVNGFLYMDLSGFLESRLFRYLTISKFRTMADEELAQILSEVYKKESKWYSHSEADIARKGIKANFFMPMLKLLINLYRQKLDPAGLEEKIVGVYEDELAVEHQMVTIMNSNSSTMIEELYSVPFDAIRSMCLMKGYMQFAMRKYNTIIRLLQKSGLDASEAEKLWQAPEANIANRYNNLIVQIGKWLKQKGLDEKVRRLCKLQNADAIRAWFEKIGKEEDHQVFIQLWEELMKEFGCRCHREIDVGADRYADVPYQVLEMALNVSDGEVTVEEEMVKRRREAFDHLRQKVKPRVFKKIERYLPTASLFMKYREHQKYAFIRILNAYHRALQIKGKQLVERHLLEKVEDVFFLQLEDLLQFERGEVDGSQFKQRVSQARSLVDTAPSFTMPRVICKPEGLMIYLSKRTREELKNLPANLLKGVPTSAGVVEGTAVVATDPHTTMLHKGEILVVKATDPSWTPLFSTTAAIAIEIGGPLTHGSVVAKELGIPCVVGIPGLTEKVKSGMKIRVDGSKGVVELL